MRIKQLEKVFQSIPYAEPYLNLGSSRSLFSFGDLIDSTFPPSSFPLPVLPGRVEGHESIERTDGGQGQRPNPGLAIEANGGQVGDRH